MVDRFIYDEHVAAVKRLRPESTIAAGGESDQVMGDGAVNGVAVETGGAGEKEVGVEAGEDAEMGGS